MKSVEILHPGLLTTVQDSGRKGNAFYAIPLSGVMDIESYNRVQILFGTNDKAVLECTLKAPKLQFHDDFQIVVSGADMNWQVNDKVIHNDQIIDVKKGDVLKGGFAKNGFRSYIGFSGQLEGQQHVSSVSSYSYADFGYNEGQPLRKGHQLVFTESKSDSSTQHPFEKREFRNEVRIKKGPEFQFLSESTTHLLSNSKFKISTQSNRMGVRLEGPSLKVDKQLKKSVPVLPGFIQLLPNGQLIVLLQDGQTTGGYPRIAYIPADQLSNFNQVALGKSLSFQFN